MSENVQTTGNTDITAHEKTFAAFVHFMARAALACILLLLFIALVNG